jgi:hypothetical protein
VSDAAVKAGAPDAGQVRASGTPVLRVESDELVVEVFRQAPAGWDEAISRFAPRVPTVLATTWWAEYMEQAVFARSWYLRVDDATGAAVGLLLAFSEYPLSRTTYAWRSARLAAALGHAIFPVLGWPCGPVVFDAAREVGVHQALAVAVAALQERCGLPLVSRAPVRPLDQANLAGIEAAWRAAGFGVEPAATLIVDLSPSLEELRAGLERSARKCLRKCEEKGLTVVRVGDDEGLGIDAYWEVFEANRPGWSGGSRRRYANTLMWEILRRHRSIELFTVKDGSETLAGIGLWHHGGYGHEFAAWMAPEAHERSLPVGDLLKWAVIVWAKTSGLTSYDLAGFSISSVAGSKEAGIRQFKEKWGGQRRDFAVVTRSTGMVRSRVWQAANHRAS